MAPYHTAVFVVHFYLSFLVNFFTAYSESQDEVSVDTILLRNAGFIVPLGRSVYLTPDDLRIRVQPGDICVVSVLDNGPLDQRPGRLKPSNFPCNFGSQEIVYSHFGSRYPTEDMIRFQIRYETKTETIFVPFTTRVKVSPNQLEIVSRNSPITVDKPMGTSAPITDKNLELKYARGLEQCRISVLPKTIGHPRYGALMNDSNFLQNVDCDEFLKLGVRYKHTAATNPPNKDNIPLFVEMINPSGKILKKEYFQISVKIVGGKDNERPRQDLSAKLRMDVIQSVMTAVTPDILAANDIETPSDQLIFNITKPLQPGSGYFINTDDRHQQITSFYQRDVRDLKIAYMPPRDDSRVPRQFDSEMQVIDADGAVSEPFVLKILVKPMNTLAPVVTSNRGMHLLEGQSKPIQTHSSFQISGGNNPDKVQIFVVGGLRHGQLRIPGGRKFFTPADIRSGAVVYQHDHSDTFSDNIIFRVSDGTNVVEFLFPIWIFPLDDEPPILNVNTGLEISKNQLAGITPLVLSATDVDSDDMLIRFVLQPPYSPEGVILKRQSEVPDDPSEWQLSDGVYERVVDEFTQSDIVNGKIFYRHIGPHRAEFITDRAKFRVIDSGNPPNESDLKEFVAKVAPVDDQPPYVYPNTSLKMEVSEFQLTEFKRKVMRYTDDDTDDREIRYRITRGLFDTDFNTELGVGMVTFCDDPEANVTVFTQAQVNHRKICYQPPSEELGLIARIIYFYYDVEDSNGNVLNDEKFSILLRPAHNQPPRIKNRGASVPEGGFIIMTPDMLDVEDTDTEDDSLLFVVMDTPEHGQIRKRGELLEVGDIFTKTDIKDGSIAYFNDGEEIGDDKFMVDVSDGIHHIPVKFNVNIKNGGDGRPALDGVRSEILKVLVEVQENAFVALTADNMKAMGSGPGDKMLKFTVQRAPYEGIILRGRDQATEFSQADILSGLVKYQHTGGEVGMTGRKDYFELSLVDPNKVILIDGSKIDKVVVEVRILPNDNEPPIVTIGAAYKVHESQKSTLFPRHLDATDIDTEDGDIMCLVLSQPNSGYLENISPAPGSDKSRAGRPISSFTVREIRSGHINYVQSFHKGFEPREDAFMFHCSDGINQSPDFRFSIEIQPFNDEEPEISLREFIVVEGGNLRIDLPILNVVDHDHPTDTLTLVISEPPKHGKIVRQTREGSFKIQNFTLDDISGDSTIAYEHDDSETKADSFRFHVLDGVHNISKTVPISIFPLDDETPRLVVNNGLQLDNAGGNKTITNKDLKADDLDSNNADLIYYVRLKPKYGYLIKANGDRITNITQGGNFTQRDIDKRRIIYVHAGTGSVRDLVKFDITDGLNSLIDRFFHVTVEGIETMFPKVINKGVELPKEGVASLTSEIFIGTDLNTPDETLTFVITRAPSRGHIESSDIPGVPISTFSHLQLTGSKIKYVHTSDDGIKMDSFEFEVTDAGSSRISRTFRISLNDVDNRKPVLMFQTLRLKEGDNKLITAFELKAEDRDTELSKIVFTVTKVPKHGLLLYNNSRVVTAFSMADLNENLISYQHDGSETMEDNFTFIVTDGTHSDFFVYPATDTPTKKPQAMNIEIVSVDKGIPQININRGASYLAELAGNHIGFRITNRILSTEDRDSPDDNLLYSVTSPPKWGYVINRAIGNRSITNWTQGDINRQQIEYILRPGVNATMDTFYFTISDKGGNVLANQPFHLNWAWISMETDAFLVNETQATLNVTLKRRGYLGETAFVTITAFDGSAKAGEDFSSRYAKQVQFNPGQTEKVWRIRLTDDIAFEQPETFELRLSDPVMAVIEYPDMAKVSIMDSEDESQISFSDSEYRVAEDIGEILIPIKRVGDISDETTAICSTVQGTANGTISSTAITYSDYITRPADHRSVVRFDEGDREKFCRVSIIDDSLCEKEEKFTVVLTEPTGGKLGSIHSVDIFIEPDKNDEPVLYLGSSEYVVDESDGFVEVKVWRTGTDVNVASSVMVRTRKSDPKSADVGLDYANINTVLDFASGVTLQTVKVPIVDDIGSPKLEKEETFLVVLRTPSNAVLGSPSEALVTINDSISDLPSMQFKETAYVVKEKDGEVSAIIVRSGDIDHESSVRCYTRQATARVNLDFQERPNTNASLIVFKPGEQSKTCVVKIIDDSLYEGPESFKLVLAPAENAPPEVSRVGKMNSTVITIEDEGDQPVIKLSDTKYTSREPMFKEETSVLKIPVVREGDLSETAIVTLNTKDGSAESGKDYTGFFRELVFGANMSRIDVDVEILYDGYNEIREVFTVHLKSRSGTAKIENSKAVVYIEERANVADVTFPDRPMVVSLRDYDRVKEAASQPVQGYPVVCVTACNPKHPNFQKTGAICEREGINDTLTLFQWRASAPGGQDGATRDLHDVDFNTFFTSTRSITLDSIYFTEGNRVQCGARAVNVEGEPGIESLSEAVTISPDKGLCMPPDMDGQGAQPFTARIRYTGASDPDHSKRIKLTVSIPHRDGLLPIISTHQLSNFELTLSRDGIRLPSHKCSNLLGFQQVMTKEHFLTNVTWNTNVGIETEPYQFSARMRSEQTIQFYRNLDLRSCFWEFVGYFDMTELVTDCGGQISTDGQVLNVKQSYLSLKIPLHVSYVFYSPLTGGSWLHYDMTSNLQLTYVYDTSFLWQNGITSRDDDAGLQGNLYLTSIRVDDDGRLVVSLLTEARFRGQFVASLPSSAVESTVVSLDHLDLTFNLELTSSDLTFDQPSQEWSFISDLSVKDYSGIYVVTLIPCMASLDQEFVQPIRCSPRERLTFDLPIRFLQVSDPVPARFSLNADFNLMKKRELWLTRNEPDVAEEETDSAFMPSDRIYARISTAHIQNLGSSHTLKVDKVFICSGKDGYIPKYDPDNQEFGCITESPNLQYTFKILDKAAPFTVVDKFRDIPFKASLAAADPEAVHLVAQHGTDGFSFSCQPIFQVETGRQWFLHVIYTLELLPRPRRSAGKENIILEHREYHHDSHAVLSMQRRRRSQEDTLGIGENGKGTNIAWIQLDYLRAAGGVSKLDASVSSVGDILLIPIFISVIILLVICAVLIVFIVKRRRKSTSPPVSPTNTITVVQNGSSKVIANKYFHSHNLTEV